MIGSVDDVSAVFYNPGALARADDLAFAIQEHAARVAGIDRRIDLHTVWIDEKTVADGDLVQSAEVGDDDVVLSDDLLWRDVYYVLAHVYLGQLVHERQDEVESLLERAAAETEALEKKIDASRSSKRELVQRAEELAESTSWKATADEMEELMNRWKRAGSGPGGSNSTATPRWRSPCSSK